MNTTIYKLDTKGNLRYLNIYTEGPDLVQASGIVGTDSPVVHRKTCTPKNIGRSNETTGEEQAELEGNAKIVIKLSEDYSETKEEAEKGTVVLPMLAKEYDKFKHKVEWNEFGQSNLFVQPKLDGMRCFIKIKITEFAIYIDLISREGKPIETMDHIKADIMNLIATKVITKDMILDGELYAHGLSFQENMKIIKKKREGSELVKFHFYDVVMAVPFSMRNQFCQTLGFAVKTMKLESLEEVPTYKIVNEEELNRYHAIFLNEGFEGTMLRHGEAPYKQNGRSENLLKFKDFQDLALVIKDVRPADQRPEWGVPVFHWEGADNNELKAGTKLTHEQRKNLLLNKGEYIGQTAELRFFEYSDTGVPRFPVMVGIRLDK